MENPDEDGDRFVEVAVERDDAVDPADSARGQDADLVARRDPPARDLPSETAESSGRAG